MDRGFKLAHPESKELYRAKRGVELVASSASASAVYICVGRARQRWARYAQIYLHGLAQGYLNKERAGG